jgi:hypothetical protein
MIPKPYHREEEESALRDRFDRAVKLSKEVGREVAHQAMESLERSNKTCETVHALLEKMRARHAGTTLQEDH